MATSVGRKTALGVLGAFGGLSLCAAAVAATPAAVQQVDDTERAFAQAVAQLGIGPGFRQFATPDAVMFLPDPTPAGPQLANAKWPGELLWRPQYIAVAGSGDLAFAMGPSLLKSGGKPSGGFYLSIWKRQPDGGWKFALDHGVDMPAAIYAGPPQPLTTLDTTPPAGPPSSEAIREADGALNVALPRGAAAAFTERLDPQGIVVRTNRPVAVGKRKALALVADSPAILEGFTLGAGRSADGAFGFTYGRARWSGLSGAQQGYYVRAWRSTPQGWRLLADHLAER
jgi:ketosteroid isomerase-like protein